MRRILILLILATAAAAAAAWFADHPGRITVDWLGYRAETSMAFLALLAVLLFVLGLALQRLATWLLRDFVLSPERRNRRKTARGYEALNAALIALATGDGRTAGRMVRKATRLLPPQPLTHVMAAEAAKLADDSAAVETHYKALAADGKAAFLGLRGLVAQARAEGREEEASRLAAEAVALRPDSRWATRALFDLQVRRADWIGALETLGKAASAGAFDAARAARHRAALLYCQAVEADLAGRGEEALRLSRDSVRLRPGFVPAALMAARLDAAKDRKGRAEKTLRAAWKETPHPALIEAFVALAPEETSHARFQRIESFTASRPDQLESRIARAGAALAADRPDAARTALAGAEAIEDARLLRLRMRLAESDGDSGGAEHLRRTAETAAVRAHWLCEGCAARRPRWTPLCPGCGRFDSYVWDTGAPADIGRIDAPDRPLALLDNSPDAG